MDVGMHLYVQSQSKERKRLSQSGLAGQLGDVQGLWRKCLQTGDGRY